MATAPRDISRQLARPLQAGDFSLAVQLYRLARTELTAGSHHLGGLALFQNGDQKEGIDSLQKAIELEPENEAMVLDLYSMVSEYLTADDAQRILEKAIAHQERSISLREFLAHHHLEQNNAQGALDVFEEALALFPNELELKLQRALCLQRLGEPHQALGELESLAKTDPSLPKLNQVFGLVLQCQNKHEQALPYLQNASKNAPDNLDVLFLLGKSQRALGNQSQALKALQQVRTQNPAHTDCLLELGNLFLDQNKFEDAHEAYTSLQELTPNNGSVHFNLGQLYRVHNQFEKAIECFEKAVELEPSNWGSHFAKEFTLPILYRSQSEITQHRNRFSQNLNTLKSTLAKLPQEELEKVQSALSSRTNFHLAYQESNDKELQRSYGEISESLLKSAYPHLQDLPAPLPTVPERKLRVGFLSAFWWQHTVGKLFSSWITQLDSNSFDTLVFSTSRHRDQLTDTIQSSAEQFISIPGDIESMARAIIDSKLDVLIFPEIGMNAEIFQLAGLRLAPIQCASWGHPVTSGLSTIDYFLSSELMEPDQSSNHYNEKLVSLPNLSIYYSTPEVISEPRVRSDFGLPADNVLFLCCQSLFKYLPHYDSIWPQIAAQVPKSTFVFIANKSSHVTSEFKKRFIRSFEGSSVDGESRMVVVPQLKRSDYFELNRMGDIYLDSLGWSGGNTTLESLTFSLPIVTWEGEFMRGRHSGAILKRMGLQPEIAASPEAYIQKAVEYGLSKEKRESIRGHITENRGRVFEDTEAIRGLESFIREAVAKA